MFLDSILKDLADSILEGNVQRISKIIDGLKGENVSIPSFLWLLNDDIRNLILLNQGGSPSSIRGLPSRKTMLANLARRVPLALLEKVVHRYNNVEKMSKGFEVSPIARRSMARIKSRSSFTLY